MQESGHGQPQAFELNQEIPVLNPLETVRDGFSHTSFANNEELKLCSLDDLIARLNQARAQLGGSTNVAIGCQDTGWALPIGIATDDANQDDEGKPHQIIYLFGDWHGLPQGYIKPGYAKGESNAA